ncbi:MAG: ATP-binding protein [Bacilli bacterium]|nr:ATP-binding protein [Bacilli bacterium]
MAKIKDYIPRLAESSLKRKLKSSGCVIVSGPKFCGKSTLCEQFAKSVTTLKTSNDIELANADPASALVGENPHLVDEWQKAPEIWNLIKDDLDKDYQFGKYILTGSTTPVDPKMIQNSAAGRITPLLLRPFSLFESKESTGAISLLGLFDKNYKFTSTYGQHNPISLTDIAHIVCRGGWPIAVKADKEAALDVTENYYNGLFTVEDESDEFAEFLKNKNIELLKMILKSFARNISTEAKNTSMIDDILESGERSTLDDDTFLSYKKTLEDLFIIYDMPAWNLNLRTSVAVRSASTHHFIDTSIATAALGIKPADLLNDLNSFGFFFEDMAVRDLSIYAESFNGELKHYRDSKGLEVDAILKLTNGEYGAIEIKIASDKNIKDGISSLNKFEKKMKENGLKTPAFKMILTSHGSSKKVGDIYIVPISMLGL